jgi:formamidopyrimidine-DNA glycosylase
MPELPDLELYRDALAARLVGERLRALRIVSPFLLRSVEPTPASFVGRRVVGTRRLGKRLVLELEGERFLILHLRIAGRLHWRRPEASVRGRGTLAAFDFAAGSLLLSEAAKKKRASLHLVVGEAALAAHDPGGVEPLEADDATLRGALARENRTLKRALTDPTIVAGIGNAYSDEILWAAELSPFTRTGRLDDAEWARLLRAVRATLAEWRERLRVETGAAFPEKVTAFRPEMAVHGRFGRPCPRCDAPVQRVVYAENEANYCARCQTGGRLLADRALSRLLHDDWPRTLDELEERRAEARRG